MKSQIGINGPVGEQGQKGHQGRMGPPGPPGPPGSPLSGSSTSGRPSSNSGYPDYYHGNHKDRNGYGHSKNVPLSPEEFEMAFLTKLNHLQSDFSSYQKPSGSKHFPALTCKNLFSDYPEFESGEYWLDPNEGAPEDAVLMFCDFEKKSSCIFPMTKKTKVKQWFRGGDGYKWLKEDLDETFKFRYSVESSQLAFLQLLSETVSQNITYYCIKSTAWHDENNDVSRSIEILGDNEREYKATTPRKHRPILLRDDCKVKDNDKRVTIIEMITDNTARLPIRDIAVYDIGDDGEWFGLELGPVCFS